MVGHSRSALQLHITVTALKIHRPFRFGMIEIVMDFGPVFHQKHFAAHAAPISLR